uniref:AC81-like protein n=1 Tax=Nilaparvata lugens endogenous nudivirus TaxID=1487700 RepID=X5GEZ8_9VIRU|nr:AC81-like protein [Nilaparvata lugens endogenous nudivirus]
MNTPQFGSKTATHRGGGGGGVHTVEIYCQATKSSFGLINHYFLVIDNYEYHMGYYAKGSVLPFNTPKGAHLVSVKTLCSACYQKIFIDYKLREDKRLFSYYPIINCETLSTGISLQALTLLVIPFIAACIYYGQITYAVILLLLAFIGFLICGKFVFSRSTQFICHHLKNRQQSNTDR